MSTAEEKLEKIDKTIKSLERLIRTENLTSVQRDKALYTISSLREGVYKFQGDGLRRLDLVIPNQYWCREGHSIDDPPCKVHPNAPVDQLW